MTDNHPSRRSTRILTLVVLALAVLPAAWPYFGADIPRTNDAPTHLYRPLALDLALHTGQLWPRWAPDLVHGYGYPIFNFFPPLSHYLVLGYYRIGLGLTTAYRAAVLTHCVLAAWAIYLLAHGLFGPVGGWAAALAYVYSPYLLYDAHVRGSLPESQALAILPLLILALQRATQRGGRWIAAVAIAFAATFMSHHGLTFQLAIPIGLLVLWLGWREGWHHLWRPLAGLALGALLISFFWLPALTEVQYTQSHVAVARGFDYRKYFLTLRELLAWPRLPADPALFNPPVVRSIPQVALALTVLVLPWRWRKLSPATRHQIGLWAGILVICIAFTMPISRLAWDHLPLLKLTLTPFRLLGAASLASALLLGASLADLQIRPRTLALLSAVAMLLLISAIPWLYPPREPMPEAPTVAHMVAFEIPPLFVGTTTFGEYLPIWVEKMPDTTELRDRLAAGESPDRLIIPKGVTSQRLSGSALDATYRITAESAVTLTYRQFYFPGWRATANGEPIPCHPSHPEGLLLIDAPAGEHTLRITFGSTWPRSTGWALSGLGALAIIAILAFAPRHRALSNAGQTLPIPWLLALPALLLTGKLFFDVVSTPLHRPTLGPEGLLDVQYPQAVDFAGELRLLGYDQSSERIAADDEVALTLYWKPLRPIGVVYNMVVHIVDESGLPWDDGAFGRPADYRFVPGTDTWPPDGYVMDPRILHLVDGTPPGPYTFQIALVRRDTGQTVAIHQMGQLVVSRPARGSRSLEEGMNSAPEAQEWSGLRLLGSRTDRDEAAPGDPARVTFLWQVVDPEVVGGQSQVTLSLLTSGGQETFSATRPIARYYPPDQWQPGDQLRTEILLRLPAHTPDGELTWRVQLGQAALDIGTLRVHAPERVWEAPPLDIQTGIDLGDVATLLGANVQPTTTLQPPAALNVTLVWRAEAETTTSYRVFLHLAGPDGNLAAQSDGEPAAWTRPSTGWLPGEIVIDQRVLEISSDTPPGEYTLSSGLYDPETGQRLTAADGSDAVRLTNITIQER